MMPPWFSKMTPRRDVLRHDVDAEVAGDAGFLDLLDDGLHFFAGAPAKLKAGSAASAVVRTPSLAMRELVMGICGWF